jgi:hypothetical protein
MLEYFPFKVSSPCGKWLLLTKLDPWTLIFMHYGCSIAPKLILYGCYMKDSHALKL